MKLKRFKTPSKEDLAKASIACVRTILPLHWAAWETSAEPMRAIGHATSQEERDEVIKAWKEMTLNQLSNVELIVHCLSIL